MLYNFGGQQMFLRGIWETFDNNSLELYVTSENIFDDFAGTDSPQARWDKAVAAFNKSHIIGYANEIDKDDYNLYPAGLLLVDKEHPSIQELDGLKVYPNIAKHILLYDCPITDPSHYLFFMFKYGSSIDMNIGSASVPGYINMELDLGKIVDAIGYMGNVAFISGAYSTLDCDYKILVKENIGDAWTTVVEETTMTDERKAENFKGLYWRPVQKVRYVRIEADTSMRNLTSRMQSFYVLTNDLVEDLSPSNYLSFVKTLDSEMYMTTEATDNIAEPSKAMFARNQGFPAAWLNPYLDIRSFLPYVD